MQKNVQKMIKYTFLKMYRNRVKIKEDVSDLNIASSLSPLSSLAYTYPSFLTLFIKEGGGGGVHNLDFLRILFF